MSYTRATPLVLLSALGLLGAAACSPPVDPEAGHNDAGTPERPPLMVDMVETAPSAPVELRVKSAKSRLVYLNRGGGTYVPGSPYDAANNVASLVDAPGTLSAFDGSNGEWSALMSCVQTLFAPYDIDITDVEPVGVSYIEAAIGGTPGELGLPASYAGVAPIAGDCSVLDDAIGFVFAAKISSARGLCETTAHELGHILGLDHEFHCPDPMTYLNGCGDKEFRDTWSDCGESSSRACRCGDQQNTHAHLLDKLGAGEGEPPLPFTDIKYSSFVPSILWLLEEGITTGCSPTTFCPKSPVTRGQMAAFLTRALSLPAAPSAGFTDTVGNTFEDAIDRLKAAGITTGCSPTTFCPQDPVTRGQMAAFLTRALNLPAAPSRGFNDTVGSIFENAIDRLAAAGITHGCGSDRFCPGDTVTREQMAAFLHRALGD